MDKNFLRFLKDELNQLKETGLYKEERVIASPQKSDIQLNNHTHVLNFCSNNYLGLANHPDVIRAAQSSYEQYGYGLASVRFICGTQTVHIELEKKLTDFLKTEETILYSSCFDANGGLFETLLGAEDAVISDSLNHASIIDGIRLCKAKRLRYKNNDMQDLEEKLKEAKNCRFRLIATDGVFSMDGIIANLKGICDLADKYNALVMVDDCHATGFLGENGRGTHEYASVIGRVDVITGTLGKALGGASGGYTSGKKEIIQWLRQRSRPYLFSNTLCPSIAAASIEVLNLLERKGDELRQKLWRNAEYFRSKMSALGFELARISHQLSDNSHALSPHLSPQNGESVSHEHCPHHAEEQSEATREQFVQRSGQKCGLAGKGHPIIPVMLGDAKLTQIFAQKMLEEGIYVVGFFYPVVPQQMARIRTQMSAAHSIEEIERAVAAFEKVGKELNVIKKAPI